MLSMLVTASFRECPVSERFRAQGRSSRGGRDNCWPCSGVLQHEECSGSWEHHLLYGASFPSNFDQFSYTQWSPQVLIKATTALMKSRAILAQYFNLAAFIAHRNFTKSIAFEETSSCDLPVLAALLQDPHPCYSVKNQERVLLNLAITSLIRKAATSSKMPFPVSPHSPIPNPFPPAAFKPDCNRSVTPIQRWWKASFTSL